MSDSEFDAEKETKAGGPASSDTTSSRGLLQKCRGCGHAYGEDDFQGKKVTRVSCRVKVSLANLLTLEFSRPPLCKVVSRRRLGRSDAWARHGPTSYGFGGREL